MPLLERGKKTLWIASGVFLFMCALVIMDTAETLPLALCMPSIYAVLSERLTRRFAALALALLPVSLAVVPGYLLGVILYLCLIACGMLLHIFIRRGKIALAVLAPSCLIFAIIAAGILFISFQNNLSCQKMISQWAAGVMNQVSAIYAQTLSQQVFNDFTANRAAIEHRVVQLFWGMIASVVLGFMWVNLLIAARINREVQLREWRCPDWFVGFFIIAGILALIGYDIPHAIGLNLMMIVVQVYFFQGMGIVAAAMAGYNWTRFLRWVIYILILTQIYIMIGVAALGLFDTWFNFRKVIRNTEGDKT